MAVRSDATARTVSRLAIPHLAELRTNPADAKYIAAMHRREFLAGMTVAPLAALARPDQAAAQAAPAPKPRAPIRQSVMASVWGANSKLSYEERCQILSKIGFKGVDMPTLEKVPIMKKNCDCRSLKSRATCTSVTMSRCC